MKSTLGSPLSRPSESDVGGTQESSTEIRGEPSFKCYSDQFCALEKQVLSNLDIISRKNEQHLFNKFSYFESYNKKCYLP